MELGDHYGPQILQNNFNPTLIATSNDPLPSYAPRTARERSSPQMPPHKRGLQRSLHKPRELPLASIDEIFAMGASRINFHKNKCRKFY